MVCAGKRYRIKISSQKKEKVVLGRLVAQGGAFWRDKYE